MIQDKDNTYSKTESLYWLTRLVNTETEKDLESLLSEYKEFVSPPSTTQRYTDIITTIIDSVKDNLR